MRNLTPIDQDFHFGSRTRLSLSQADTLLISELQPFGTFSPRSLFWPAKRQFRGAGNAQNREALRPGALVCLISPDSSPSYYPVATASASIRRTMLPNH